MCRWLGRPTTSVRCFECSPPPGPARRRLRREASLRLRCYGRDEAALARHICGRAELDGDQLLAIVDGENVGLVEDRLSAYVLGRWPLAEGG